MKKITRISIYAIICAIVFSAFTIPTPTTHASSDSIDRKVIANGLAEGLSSDDSAFNRVIEYDDSQSAFLIADSVFNEGVGAIPVPSSDYFNGVEGTMTYLDVYKGFSESNTFNTSGALGYKGLNGYTTTWGNSDYTEDGVPVILAETGYVATSSSTGNSIQIKGNNSSSNTGEFSITIVQEDGQVYVDYSNVPMSHQRMITYDEDEGSLIILSGDSTTHQVRLTGDIATDTAAIQTAIGNQRAVIDGEVYEYDTATSGAKTQYVFQGNPEAVAKNLTGVDSLDLTDQERYELYDYYIEQSATSMDSAYCGDSSLSTSPDDMVRINLQRNGKWVTYYYYKNNFNPQESYQVIKEGGGGFDSVTFDEMVSWMNDTPGHEAQEACESNANSTTPIAPAFNPPSGAISSSSGNDVYAEDVDCWNSAGAGGWLVCWVIDFAQNTITAIYNSIVSNFLEFRASFLEIRGDNPVYTAWQTFQSFANIAFVIVLLIVIFSQLTGVGIDNLGIKRVLPKLIVAAILINLSYIICMLFVDLSNILGSGLNSLFANMSVTAQNTGISGSAVLSTIIEGAVAGAVGGLAVATVGIWGGVVVIPLVLGLITTLIGILFFFILLGARQAAIVMLVVISPVAFACYMLPNTKQFFDKWLKIFEAMLLLYPICGLLMGGSAFASDILLTLDQGFLGKLIAMLVGVVPFFFIPSLLRGAFSAMGNLGAKISGFGQNMGRRITGTIANSDTVRDANTRLRTGIDRDGNLNALGRYRERAAKGETRLGKWASRSRIPGVSRLGTMAQESNRRANARAQAGRIKYLDERAREDRLNDLGPEYFSQYKRSQEMAAEKQQLNATIDTVNDATNKGESQGQLFSMYDNAIASGDVFTARAVAEIAGRRKDTANAFIEKFKQDSADGKYAGREDIVSKVAKQISTGDNSKNYRAANALGFEYASQIVQGNKAAISDSGVITDYGSWAKEDENIHSAIDHHITNGAEMYGQSNSSLRELAQFATNHQAKNSDGSLKYKQDKNGNLVKDENGNNIPIMHDDKNYLANLARRAEAEGRTSGTYDVTKEDSFKNLKALAPATENSNDWQEGSSVNVNQQSGNAVNSMEGSASGYNMRRDNNMSASESLREIQDTGRHVATDDELVRARAVLQREIDRNPQNASLETYEKINNIDQELGRRQNQQAEIIRQNQQNRRNQQNTQGNQSGQNS